MRKRVLEATQINYFSTSLDRTTTTSGDDDDEDDMTIPRQTITARFSSLQPQTFSTGCKSYSIIASRGTGESQIDANGSRNLISQVFANIPDGEAYEVTYPASFNFLTDPELGAADMMTYMTLMRQKCPDQRFLLFGYCQFPIPFFTCKKHIDLYLAQGAMVTMNCLNTPEMRNLRNNVRGIMFTGDPYYRPYQPQDRGTARTGLGIGHLKNLVEPRNVLPPEYAAITRDFCNEGDPVCQGIVGLNPKDVLTLTVPAHHYENTPQESEMIQFAIQQLRS